MRSWNNFIGFLNSRVSFTASIKAMRSLDEIWFTFRKILWSNAMVSTFVSFSCLTGLSRIWSVDCVIIIEKRKSNKAAIKVPKLSRSDRVMRFDHENRFTQLRAHFHYPTRVVQQIGILVVVVNDAAICGDFWTENSESSFCMFTFSLLSFAVVSLIPSSTRRKVKWKMSSKV